MKKILLLEDDQALRTGIVLALKSPEYTFVEAETIQEAKEKLTDRFDLLILDVNLPDGSGFDLCKEVRQSSRVPIILLTARDLELDVVTGLEYGADDYITKPVSLMILRARVNALLRRFEEAHTSYQLDQFFFDFDKMLFKKAGQLIELSKTEQRLLKLFISNPNQVLSRELLIERIWSVEADFVDANALSVTIKRLRDKLESVPAKPVYIQTVYGQGYRWSTKGAGE